jgi:hypothetical protein
MDNNFRPILGILLVFILVGSVFIGNTTRADVIDTFGNGAQQIIIPFEYAGSNHESAYFELSVNSTIKSGSFKVKGQDYGGYPSNVTINVGADEDIEWEFIGKGYGALGYQNQFNDTATQKYIYIDNKTYHNTTRIKLPKNANVLSAYLTLDGEGATKEFSGSYPLQFAGSFNDIYTYLDIPIKYIWFSCYSNDFDSYHIDVEGMRIDNNQWEQIYYYHGDPYPGDQEFNFDPPIYKRWKIHYYDSDNNDWISYSYEYHVGNAMMNPKLDVGDNGNIDWSASSEFKTVAQTKDLATEFNKILTSGQYPVIKDKYGNEFIDVPLNFSCNNIGGGVIVRSINIEYDYASEIKTTPKGVLTSELNEHIMESFSDPAMIPIMVSTDTSGKVDLFDVELEYNIPPQLSQAIPDLEVDEDVPSYKLLKLSDYFIDTDEDSSLLNYTIKSNSQKTKLDVRINLTEYIETIPIEENWNGETEAVVMAEDSYGKSICSNKFVIKVNPINDEPFPNKERIIDDVLVYQGSIDKSIELENMGYFIDIENDELYFDCTVDPLDEYNGENLTAYVNDDNVLCIIPGEYWYGDGVKIWIYADDDEDVNTLEDGGYYCYQEIEVDVNPVKSAPVWDFGGIPDIYRDEDATDAELSSCLDLKDYVTDADTPLESLSFNVMENTNDKILVIANKATDCIDLEVPQRHYYGSTKVTVRASDKDGFFADVTFNVHIVSVNDLLEIEIRSHKDWEEVDGVIEIYGTSFDVEDTINVVEIKIGYFSWQPTIGINNYSTWNYTWDTTMVDDIDYLIEVRAFDGEDFASTYVNLTVANGINRLPKVTINSPSSNSKVEGMILIEGTASDDDGEIEKVELKIGDGRWYIAQGTENWTFYWDTTTKKNGNYAIYARASDGEDYSPQRTITLVVDNGITEDGQPSSVETIIDYAAIIILIIIVIIILIMVVMVVSRRRKAVKETANKAESKETRIRPDEVVQKPSSAPKTAVGLDIRTDFALEKMGGYKVAKPLPMDAKPTEPSDTVK